MLVRLSVNFLIYKLMYKIRFILLLLVAAAFSSCNDYETYAEKKESERDAIKAYLNSVGAKTMTEDEFRARGCVTDTAKNEWVLLSKSSVYMQVINKGTFYNQDILAQDGRKVELECKMKPGETRTILCRYIETNLFTNHVTSANIDYSSIAIPEMMTVTRSSDTYTGSFVSGHSNMYATYGSLSIPTGWLVPLPYLNIGRCGTEFDEIASVKIIVPHSQGQPSASQNVIPCLYEISYQEGI